MIIDIHTHTYPDAIAHKAIEKLGKTNDLYAYTDGTLDGLKKSQAQCEVDYSVLLPVVTKPSQTETINIEAAKINETTSETHILSFAGIHPENEDYKAIIKNVAKKGFKGIKLHPMFQATPLDNISYVKIIDEALSYNLKILIHGGADISFIGCDYASPERTRSLVKELGRTDGIIIAHMGGILDWDRVIDTIGGYGLYLDTSSTTCTFLSYEGKKIEGLFRTPLDNNSFVNIINAFGADHVLFGSDSPWMGQREALDDLYAANLEKSVQDQILGGNAARLLGI